MVYYNYNTTLFVYKIEFLNISIFLRFQASNVQNQNAKSAKQYNK